jgi:hypothetical protein
MTKEQAKDLIVKHITDVQGCKSIEFAFWSNVSELLNELISEKRIIEIAYVLPNMSYREKSFLLPGNTDIFIRGK